MNKLYQNKAFSKNTASLFILDTPFQLLCAMEALKEFEIAEYLIIATFENGERRNEQVLQMLKEQELNYKIEWVTNYWGMVNDCLKRQRLFDEEDNIKEKWSRIFIGNYNALDHWVTAIKYAATNASIVFMDDGSSSIELLSLGHGTNVEYEQQFGAIWKTINVDVPQNFFTIYSDISSKIFNIYQNSFAHIFSYNFCHKNIGNVYIIGTNSIPYSNSVGLTLPEYEGLIWRKLSEIRNEYPDDTIIYIPHGRDTNPYVEKFCKLLGIVFQPLDYAVEYHFIKNNIAAKYIYGFGSTALFTLKKLIPTANIVNWFIDNPDGVSYAIYKKIAIYYEKHNIVMEIIKYPHVSYFKKIKRSIKFFLNKL